MSHWRVPEKKVDTVLAASGRIQYDSNKKNRMETDPIRKVLGINRAT